MAFTDFFKQPLSPEEEQELIAQQALMDKVRRGELSIEECFTKHIRPAIEVICASPDRKQLKQTFKTGQLREAVNQLEKSLKTMAASTDPTGKEQTAAKEIAAQHLAMFDRIRKQHERFTSGQAAPASGFFQSMRNSARANALGIVNSQKDCFEALSTAYGKKVNKPQLVWTAARAIITIGLACALLPLTWGIPFAGIGFAAAGGFFANSFAALGIEMFWGKILVTGGWGIVSAIGNKVFNANMEDSLGSSPESMLLPKGFFEIDNENGEKISKSINIITELANKVLDDGEQHTVKKREADASSGEYDPYNYDDPLNPLNPTIQ